jgi:hypothetical protein
VTFRVRDTKPWFYEPYNRASAFLTFTITIDQAPARPPGSLPGGCRAAWNTSQVSIPPGRRLTHGHVRHCVGPEIMTEVPMAQSDAPSQGACPIGTPLAQPVTRMPGWLRSGAGPGPAGAGRGDAIEPLGDEDAVELNLEIEDGETTLFEAAVVAFHSGDFQRAESLFLEEAQRTIDSAPQRAAISYRQAALAARRTGNMDASDHWMRLAGREYLRVTEDDRTPLPFIREAAMMAAKCFLSVENLNVASKGLRRAQAIESVLRADDDLMAESNGAQPAAQAEPDRHNVDLRIERRATVRSAPAATSVTGAPSPPSDSPRPAPSGEPNVDVPAVVAGRSNWLQRLRHLRPARHVA